MVDFIRQLHPHPPPRPSMTASSTLPSIPRLPVLRTGSIAVLPTTASFTVTFSQSTTLGTTSSRNNDNTSRAPPSSSPSYSSMSSVPPTTNSGPTSVVTVEVSSSGDGDNNNNNSGQSYPIGLILGIVTGFSILILVMGIMFLILWRNRQHMRPSSGGEASEALLMSRRKRKKGSGAAEPRPLHKVSVDSDSTGSEGTERPLPTPPSSRRGGASKQPAHDEREEGRSGARMPSWPTSVGTSAVPVRWSRDSDAAGDRTGPSNEERPYRPYRLNDTTFARSPPDAIPTASPILTFSTPRPPPAAALDPSQRRRLSHPEVRASINPLGMHPPPLRIVTKTGSAPANLSHHHFRSRSSDDIANSAAELAAPATPATNRIRPPTKHYLRQISRLHHPGNPPHNDGLQSFVAAPIYKIPSEPPTTATTGRSGHRSRSSELDSISPHSQDTQYQQLEFFELSPPPRRRRSSWSVQPEGENDNKVDDTTGLQQNRLPVEDKRRSKGDGARAGRIDRGSGLRISGVPRLAQGRGGGGDGRGERRNDETSLRV